MEDLMKPRFEIIAEYPGLSYNLGRILTPVKDGDSYYHCLEAPSSELVREPEKYPHLFRKMNWWDKKTEEEMPKYVKHQSGGVYLIEKWDMITLFGYTDLAGRNGCSLSGWNPEYGYFPATEEEYEEYIKSL